VLILPDSIRNETYFINENHVPQVEKGKAPDKKITTKLHLFNLEVEMEHMPG
jgi:hypothetical protein